MASVALREWTSVGPGDCAALAGRRLAPGGSTWRLAQALTAGGRLIVRELADGLALQATSWVGRVTLDDLTITVRPKIPALPLMTLLRYAYGLRDLQLTETACYAGEAGAFQDLLIAQLIAEAGDLLARGLHSITEGPPRCSNNHAGGSICVPMLSVPAMRVPPCPVSIIRARPTCR